MRSLLPLLALLGAPGDTIPPEVARGAVCYEVFVRSFQDSDGDGVGDLRGLVQRLDHVNDGDPRTTTDLGASCIWLMPVAESPSYHGYDVADYFRVDREYGTADDFRLLMREAHRRGIRVILDLVLNHTSEEHPYFQSALRDPASPYRAWYRFAPRPGGKNPWGGDNWHRSPIRDEYFYGFFWKGMPDLDYRTPAVRAEAARVADFWLREMGADGFRLDAVSFLMEDDSLRVQHTPGTHAVLREFAGHVRRASPAAFTVGEVWDSTARLVPYYPDQLDAYFAFEVSDSLVAAVRTARAAPLLAAVARAQRELPAGRWAPFLRNHDQDRAWAALGGGLGRARAAATLLLTLPGTPFIYYGEEIGMRGTKTGPDGDAGVRTPMQWSAGPGAGFTRGTPWRAPHADSASVAAQTADPGSLLSHYRRLVRLRASVPPLATGDWMPLRASHPSVAAYLRRGNGRAALVVVNLGAARLSGVSLSSDDAVLAPEVRSARVLLGGGHTRAPRVGPDGRMRDWVPFASLEPMGSYVVELR